MGRTHLAEAPIKELKQRIKISNKRKTELTKYLHELWNSYQKGLISRDFYVETAHRHFDGKTLKQWIDYYDHHIHECKKQIRQHKKENIKGHLSVFFFAALIIFIVFIASIYIKPELTGFLVQEVPEIITQANATVTTTQHQATLGQPVKWTKTISLDKPTSARIRLPLEATNISVNKIIESYSEEINQEALLKEDLSPSQEEPSSSEAEEVSFSITGGVIGVEGESRILRFLRNIARLTGRTIEEPSQEIEINDTATEYEIEYETPAPTSFEEPTATGKRIKIIGPETIHYENVLSFTELDENLNIVDPSSVRIYWLEEDRYVPIETLEDTNNNGIYDYIEWIVPYLSTQTFEIKITSGIDSFVNQNQPDTNYGNNSYIIVSEGSEKYTAGLIEFDVNNIPFGLTINHAKLRLYFNNSVNNPSNSINISIRRITSDWNESTLTWNNKPSYTSEYTDKLTLTDNYGWIEWDIKDFVQGWVNGSYTNYGLAIVPEQETATTDKRFISSDYSNSSLHPILDVNYTYEGTWTIDGNAVYINDSRVYIRTEPHTLTSSGVVYFNITSKIYEGDIDIVFGFNTSRVKPRKIGLYNPHNVTWNTTHIKTFYNVTSFTNTIASCDYGFEYNTFKKNGTYYEPIFNETNEEEEEIIGWNETSSIVCYDSYVQNGSNYTLTWHQEHSEIEDYVDKTSMMTSINYTYGGMNKWWYIKNITINKNQNYMFQGVVDVPVSGRGKYWFAIKPSSETIQEAISNDHFYYLDPWWEIIKADHLDENRSFISDIYEEVKALDDNWSETIPSGDYVRVTFEQELDFSGDITIYPRIVSGTPKIEVYEINETELIAEFTNIVSNKYNKVFLTNLVGEQDTFDLRVVEGSIEIDHIVDPPGITYNNVASGGSGDITNTFELTVNAGSDKIIIVGVGVEDPNDVTTQTVSGVTWNTNEDFTQVTGAQQIFNNDRNLVDLWYLLNPTETTANIVVTTNEEPGRGQGAGAIVINGAKQQAPEAVAGTIGDSDAPSVSITTQTNNAWVIDVMYVAQSGRTVTEGAGQIERYEDDANGQMSGGGSTELVETAGEIAMSWSLSSGGDWGIACASFEEVVADTEAPKWFDNSTNGTFAGTYIEHRVRWTDAGLSGYIFEFDNGTGTFTNDSWVSMTGTNNWSNVSKIVNSTIGSTIRWRVYANDTASPSNWNQTDIFIYNTTSADTEYPQFSSYWDDNASLVGSGTGHFNVTVTSTNGTVLLEINGTNITATNLTANMYNASHTFISNGTYPYRWHSWGNGTLHNYNKSVERSYTVNVSYGWLNVSISKPEDNSEWYQNYVNLTVNATVICQGGDCGTVSALARYNLTASPDTAINTTQGATPFYIIGTEGWNLSTATYDNVNMSTQDSISIGLFFKSDGTKLYEIGGVGGLIYQYTCSDAWNVSSCTYDTINMSTQGSPSDLFFKPDGTKLYELALYNDFIFQYTCSDAWNLSSCDYDDVSILTQSAQPGGLFFKSDGTKLYEIGNTALIYQSSCSDPWNLSSCTYDTISISTQDASPTGLFFKSDGTKLYEIGDTGSLIYQSSCSDAWNLSSCTYDIINMSTQDTDAEGLFFKSDGTKLYEIGADNNLVYQYSLSGGGAAENPQLTTLNQGDSYQFNWTLNVTTSSTISYLIDVLFNSTTYYPSITENDTENSLVKLNPAVNNPPTINWVEAITDDIDPTDDSVTSITFNFTATDTDGYTNINVSTAESRFQLSGETTRLNLSCVNWSQSGDDVNFTCNISMWYFDKADTDWIINVTIKDNSAEYAENSSTNFTYNTLTAMKMSPTSLEWDEINLTDTNTGSNNDPIVINNTGNEELLNINVTAKNLQGEQYTSYYIYAANFTVENASEGCDGTSMVNATSINVTSAILYRGNHSLNYKNATSGQEELFFCLKEIPSENPAQSYSSSAFGTWEIRILLVAIIPAARRRKKKKLKKRKEITENLSIPTTIFSENIGALETVIKYLRENLGMSYHEIARYLNRDERTIWTAYQKAIQKQHQIIEVKETKMFLPVSILRNRKLTVLESLIVYLKSKEMKYSEIAEIIGRDQRNIRTAYQKAVKKLKEREFKDLIKTEAELIIPATIFSKKLGVLESLIKYMKENLNMNYKEIAEKLGRDQRTIWTAYKKATEKQKEPIKPKETKIFLPISAFENKKLTILESIILYLKSKGFKFSEIAKLLDRNQRNIWTIYSRTKKKLLHKDNNI